VPRHPEDLPFSLEAVPSPGIWQIQ
jgi:hypothetical protein